MRATDVENELARVLGWDWGEQLGMNLKLRDNLQMVTGTYKPKPGKHHYVVAQCQGQEMVLWFSEKLDLLLALHGLRTSGQNVLNRIDNTDCAYGREFGSFIDKIAEGFQDLLFDVSSWNIEVRGPEYEVKRFLEKHKKDFKKEKGVFNAKVSKPSIEHDDGQSSVAWDFS